MLRSMSSTVLGRLLVAAGVALVLPAAVLAAGLLEAPWRAYDAGLFPNIGPQAIAAGDLDGDGDRDLVLALSYFGGPGISVLMNLGGGVYGAPTFYETGFNRSVHDVVLVDVSRDGRPDVVATIPDSFGSANRIGYWRNLGDGTLAARREFTTGPGPRGLVAADFTGDGFPDVVTADYGQFSQSDTVSLLAHNGLTGQQAGFLPRVSSFVGILAWVPRAGDLDGDGDIDLVVGRETGQLTDRGTAVMLNDGHGVFSAPVYYDPAPSAFYRGGEVALADMDGDGDLDLLGGGATNGIPNVGIVSLRRNDGAGNFGPAEERRLTDWTFTLSSLEAADLDGDGLPEVVATTDGGRSMDGYNVVRNDAGSLGAATFYEAAKWTTGTALIDADGDGDRDVLTSSHDSSVVTVHENLGGGEFLVLPNYPVGVFTSGIDRADLDGDGDLDIATADSEVQVLINRGDGTFEPARQINVPINPGEVKLRDLDNDGDFDILVGPDRNSPPYHFAVSLNNGDGTFAPGVITFVNGSQAGSIDAFDLDNDGLLDVVLNDPGPAGAIRLARNLGNGVSFALQTPITGDGLPFGIGGADFDGDGNMDLVTNNAFGLTVYLGDGDFTFGFRQSTGVTANGFAVGDLNLDGDADLAFYEDGIETATIFVGTLRGFGDGTFAFPVRMRGPIGLEGSFRISSDIGIADLTGDGFPDLVLSSNAPDDVSVFRNTGDGTVAPDERYGAGYSPSGVSLGDFDGDGSVDVATPISLPPSGISNAVVVLFNRGGFGGLDLAVTGSCPGAVTLIATGAAPGAPVAFLGSPSPGSLVIPPGRPCAGTELGLGAPLRLLGSAVADGDSRAERQLTAPAAACGRALLQAIDGVRCVVSDVEGL